MKKSFVLKQERQALVDEARAAIETVETEKRDFTPEEKTAQEERMAKIDQLTATIKERESLEGLQDIDSRDLPKPMGIPEERKETPEEKEIRSFGELLIEKRDFSAGMNSGAFIRNPIDTKVREGIKVFSQLRGCAVVTNMAGNETIPVDAGTVTAALVSEKGTYADGGGSLDAVNFVAYKVGSIIKISDEALKDVPANVAENAIFQFTKAVAKFENQYCLTGTGSGQPQGILTGGSAGYTAAAAAALVADDIRGLFTSLDTSLLPHARGWCAQATMLKLMALADSTKYIEVVFDSSIGMYRVLGVPFYINSNMPAATAGLKPIVIGDPNFYEIKDRDGLEVKVLSEKYADAGQVGYRLTVREDAHVMDSAAFKYLTMKAS